MPLERIILSPYLDLLVSHYNLPLFPNLGATQPCWEKLLTSETIDANDSILTLSQKVTICALKRECIFPALINIVLV